MEISRKADMKKVDGPAEYFTGKATIAGQFQRPHPSRVGGAIVHFSFVGTAAHQRHPKAS